MTSLSFATTISALLKGASKVTVVAPKSRFAAKRFPAMLGPELDALAKDLASDTEPGDAGRAVATLTGGKAPRKLVAAVLPDRVARHNSPARADAIRNVVKSGATGSGKSGVVLVLDTPDHVVAAVNAVARAVPEFARKESPVKRRVQVLVTDPKGKPLRVPVFAKAVVQASRDAARLVDTPPTEMNPAAVAREARAMLRGIKGVRIREVVGDALLAAKLGGIHGVGRCAVEEPRLFVATHAPANAKRHVALVGKGVTYDTGGLNIKVGGAMSGMKRDMGGAAAVLGAFRVLASTGCKHKVSLVLCLAENAIGPAAYKPDDILTMHSGKTVEINNTDAEGRLLLADGVSWAARKLGADVVFDAATLTGAQLIATGHRHAAVVSNDAELEAITVAAGRTSGDLCHPLPFCPEFYRKEFASAVADMKNSVKDRRNAQSSCAAQFVYNHLEGQNVRWCHIDMAGPSHIGERASGYGVALLAEAGKRVS